MVYLSWLAFGLIVGLVANLLEPENQSLTNTFGNIVMGIIGAATGGFLSSVVFGTSLTQFGLIPLLSAGIASVLLLFVGNNLANTS